MPEATHSLKRDPNTLVRLIVWTHKEPIQGSDLNVGVHQGDVYYQTVVGQKTEQERRYDVQMLGQLRVQNVLDTFEPLPDQMEYHNQLIANLQRISG